METKIVFFIFTYLVSFVRSSQNVEKLPNTFSTNYHSPANEVSSSFYYTQNLQSRNSPPTESYRRLQQTHNPNILVNHPHGAAENVPFLQIHYPQTPVKTHSPQSSLNSLPDQYLPPFKFNSQPLTVQYSPSYFETTTTSPKPSINSFLYNQYLPSATPPSNHFLPSSIAYQQHITPSNQIGTGKIQNPFLISTPFGQHNTKEYRETNSNNYSKNRIILLSLLENQKNDQPSPKFISSARSKSEVASTPTPLQFSQAGGATSHVEFSSADVNYKW